MPRARRFDWNNLGLRIVSGAVLAPAALAIVWIDVRAFLVLISIAVALLSIEWGQMVAPAAPVRVAATVMVTVLAAVFLTYLRQTWAGWGIIAFGALGAAVAFRRLTARAMDAAYGVLYIAPACLALIWLRQTLQGQGWTVMLLSTTWAADICAFAAGNALKGPKLWPRFSPNKTWSGFFGGLLGAVSAAVAVPGLPILPGGQPLMHLSLAGAALIGLTAGLATMMGDLWESMLKRRFGVKDSGDLIPGHGGLLDRVDGLMFATMVFAAARLIVRYGWAH